MGDEQWCEAIRPDFPLHNNAGDLVEEAEWKAQSEEASRGMWSKPLSEFPSGALPAYRRDDREAAVPHAEPDQLESLRDALPSEDFIRELCHDARNLVIGCAIHVCSPSCYKYHSDNKSQICRHNFYHAVTYVGEDFNDMRR